jgi:heat-inducible transcriptional repressor
MGVQDMASDHLDERKKRILRAVTIDYITSGEPVGSRTIARKYDLGLSPATIRNEMADLEDEGYLQQPHTSAGRIPSEQGYRFYVDALVEQRSLTSDELRDIHSELEVRHHAMDQLIQQASKVLAQLTRFPSMALTPQPNHAVFRHIQLVPLNEKNILVLMVTDSGLVENRVLSTEIPWSYEELERISNLFNQKLRGRAVSELPISLINEIRSAMAVQESAYHEAMRLLLESLEQKHRERVYTDGAVNILDQPEFKEIERFKPLMDLLEEEDNVYDLLKSRTDEHGVSVLIGHENKRDLIQDCSVVTANYRIGPNAVGVIGVLGPTRMDYAKVISVVDYMASYLGKLLSDLAPGRSD